MKLLKGISHEQVRKMNLQKKKDFLAKYRDLLSEAALTNYAESFSIEYTHNSTAIEGNTLSLMETKLLLDDRLSVGGKQLREIYEVVNHNKAFNYIEACIAKGDPLDEKTVKDIHAVLMENIMQGGIYRSVDVYISGAQHTPPSPNEMYRQIKQFYMDLSVKSGIEPIELAAWTHAEFVRIHPFVDGNGRTARLIMNYQLMRGGYLPISIAKEDRMKYFDCLEQYALHGNLKPFEGLVAELEETRLDSYIKAIEQTSGIMFEPEK